MVCKRNIQLCGSMKKLSLVLVMCFFVLLSCSKEEEAPVFSPVPTIEFVSMSPGNVQAWKDSVAFTIKYEDGDGDLGENTAGSENLFLTDSRTNGSYTFRIRELVPKGASVPVKGSLRFVLPFTFLSDESVTSEQVSFEIQVKDRAGRESNKVKTPVLQVRR
jgi:hypothetical protein